MQGIANRATTKTTTGNFWHIDANREKAKRILIPFWAA